jgi:addiction module HigA family antidote
MPTTFRLSITMGGDNMKAVHPGRILKRELKAREVSANKLALALRVPSGRISEILRGRRRLSAETALRLSQYFGNSAQFWMNLQTRYDLAMVEKEKGAQIKAEVVQAA